MIIQHVNNKSFCWVQRQSKLVWRMFTFFVVGFVNNSDFFIFLEKKKSKLCVHLFCIAQKKMFSLNIAKWVCDICRLLLSWCKLYVVKTKNKKKKKSRKEKKHRENDEKKAQLSFVQVVYVYGKNHCK